MLVFIPMAGFGDRYLRAGYTEPKPLIPVDGKPMIERVLAAFRGAPEGTRFLFTINAKHAAESKVKETIARIAPDAGVAIIEPHKDGPARTLLDSSADIPDDEEVILNYCDFGVDWSYPDFLRWLKDGNWDGAMTAYRGFHPHSLGPTLYAYMRSEGDRVLEIKEKHHFTNDKLSEYASSGLYYFKTGALMKRIAKKLVDSGERTNGEFYASTMQQLLIDEGLRVGVYPLAHFYQWGTPEDLRDFEDWLRAMRRWSSFEQKVARRSTRAAQVIPMAGRGQRFVDQGYADPKPLVPVRVDDETKPMIARALSCLPKAKERVLVVQRALEDDERFKSVVQLLGGRLVVIDRVTEGQASTARLGTEGLPANEPVLFAPCDAGYVYDAKKLEAIESAGFDAIAWTARAHLPAIWRPKMYGWTRVDAGRIVDVRVKEIVPDVPLAEQEVITGTFWFKDVATFLEEERALVEANDRVNGEFYIDTIIKRMVEAKKKVGAFTVDKFLPWGTPEELKTFEYYGDVRRILDAEDQRP